MRKDTLFASTKSARRLESLSHFTISFSIAKIQVDNSPGTAKDTLRTQLILRDFVILFGSLFWIALQGLAFGIPRVVRR